MPGAEHIDRHDLFRAARRVVRQGPEMHHASAALRRTPDRGGIQQIHSVGPVEADHLMTDALQMTSDRDPDVSEERMVSLS
jgi:hypothetical protein